MKKVFSLAFIAAFTFGSLAYSQGKKTYTDSVNDYRQQYVGDHEVVGKDDKQYLQFFSVDPQFRVWCKFRREINAKWFSMKTSGSTNKIYRKYGVLSFQVHDTLLHLNVYQSQSLLQNKEYQNYLFVPFTDLTSGNETYGGGRYLDCKLADIQKNNLILDFNKAYNPYCAYTTGYNCPIPPAENDLPIAIRAGEKVFGKKH